MSREACTVNEFEHPSGYRMVRLENSLIAVTVVPEKGADIYSIEDRALAVDVLWKAPWGLRRASPGIAAGGSSSEMAWMDSYAGGWQGIFPNAGSDCFYRGAHHNFHGEASLVVWNYSISRSSDCVSIHCDTALIRSPFRLQRCIEVRTGSPVLHIRESITNHGADTMQFIWGHHPALGAPFLSEHCVLQVPARSFQDDRSFRMSSWNSALCHPVPAPDAQLESFGYLTDFDAGWYSIFNRKLGLGFALAWPLEVFPCAWLWQEFGGTRDYPWYGRTYVMAVEPFTTPSARGLASAAASNTAASLGPGESVHVELAAVLYREDCAVKRFSTTGELVFTK